MSNKTTFKKGNIPWNKGTKGVMKAWNKGKKRPDAHLNLGKLAIKGAIPWNKGKKLSPEHIENLRKAHIGQKAWNKGIEWEAMKGNTNGFKKGQKTWNKGMKNFFAGENHYNWKGGITPLNRKIRTSVEYKEWRNIVLKRDDYTCQICGKRGGKLEVDHIKPFSLYPDLRLDINNGRTLCPSCHRKTTTYAGRLTSL